MRSATLYLLLATTATACTQPRIDASSDDVMKESVARVRSSLPEDRRAQFDTALQLVAFSAVSLENLFVEGATGGARLETKMKDLLNGKTADEVFALSDSIKAAREAKEREQALQEIAELEAKKRQADAVRVELAKFQVVRSRFYRRRNVLDMVEPMIELTVVNGTSHAISRAYFVGTLASPGRSVPWLKDSFNYRIRGGLEPGERASWSLAPNMFGDWARAEAPAGAVLTVEVVRLDGPDGKTLFSVEEFDEEDAQRLAALRSKFGQSR